MVIWGTLLQRRVPAHMLGRVSSLDFFVSLSFMPLSMALAGPVSLGVGLPATFALAGLLPTVIAILAIVLAKMPKDELAHPLDLAAEPGPGSETRDGAGPTSPEPGPGSETRDGAGPTSPEPDAATDDDPRTAAQPAPASVA